MDPQGLGEIQEAAGVCQQAINNNQWVRATQKWRETQWAVMENAAYVDFYNILQYWSPYDDDEAAAMEDLTEDELKKRALERFKKDGKTIGAIPALS